MYVVDDRKR